MSVLVLTGLIGCLLYHVHSAHGGYASAIDSQGVVADSADQWILYFHMPTGRQPAITFRPILVRRPHLGRDSQHRPVPLRIEWFSFTD